MELAAQKEALDIEHCRALDNLKKQVIYLVISALLWLIFSKRSQYFTLVNIIITMYIILWHNNMISGVNGGLIIN